MKVLLSIKPEYVARILNGEKKYEYRKRIFKEHISSVVVYSTMPIGKIVGEFTIEEVLNDTPQKLWKKTSDYSGVSLDFFMDYFGNRSEGYALKIKEFVEYKTPVDPKVVFNTFIPPQSYKYLDEDFMDVIYNCL